LHAKVHRRIALLDDPADAFVLCLAKIAGAIRFEEIDRALTSFIRSVYFIRYILSSINLASRALRDVTQITRSSDLNRSDT